jgi:hypothetical protein
MKKIILALMLIYVSANADFWKKLVNYTPNQGQYQMSKFDIGVQAGYQDYYQGIDNYVPIRNDFYDGYANGAKRAEFEIRQQRNNQQVIIIYQPINNNYPNNTNNVNYDERLYYDH